MLQRIAGAPSPTYYGPELRVQRRSLRDPVPACRHGNDKASFDGQHPIPKCRIASEGIRGFGGMMCFLPNMTTVGHGEGAFILLPRLSAPVRAIVCPLTSLAVMGILEHSRDK